MSPSQQHDNWSVTGWRWLKFSLVGGVGVGVQLAVLALLNAGLGLDYLPATALAVEAAVLHNFFWHHNFTWADRRLSRLEEVLGRLARFNLSNGAVSILGNVLLMRLLVGQCGMQVVPANLLTIAGCSLVNFFLSDHFVFLTTLWRVAGTREEEGETGSRQPLRAAPPAGIPSAAGCVARKASR